MFLHINDFHQDISFLPNSILHLSNQQNISMSRPKINGYSYTYYQASFNIKRNFINISKLKITNNEVFCCKFLQCETISNN